MTQTRNLPNHIKTGQKNITELKVASILDELSEKFFPFECDLLNLDARSWLDQIEEFQPDLLFVESVWNGYKKTWRGKVTQNNFDLIQLVNWCKKKDIPTLFWNKEDPIHMFTFLNAAFLFDYVLTTDMDCIPLYKRLLKHERVYLLPFATSIQLFTPIETYDRKEAACFAGSYYAKREDRRQDFENLADLLIENYKLEIYDRNPYPDNPDYQYPDRFHKFIKGTLPVDQIDIAYKSYQLGVTLNIVKKSSTMEARRIFELLGCNTLSISNPCLGIKNLFGEIVLQDENLGNLSDLIREVSTNKIKYEKIKLLGLRKILQEHTYRERLEYIFRLVFGFDPIVDESLVAVFAIVNNKEDVERISKAFARQTYQNKALHLFTTTPSFVSEQVLPLDKFQFAINPEAAYVACFSLRNYYGVNYLMDLMLATRYSKVSAIGKSCYYQKEEQGFIRNQGYSPYRLIDQINADRTIISTHLISILDPEKVAAGEQILDNLPILSVDPYNFCENLTTDTCPEVDDLSLNTGIKMEDLYKFSENLSAANVNYDLGYKLANEQIQAAIFKNGNVLKTIDHPLGYFAFFSTNKGAKEFLIDKDIPLTNLLVLNELTGQPNLYVYVNGILNSNTFLNVKYYSRNNQYLGGYVIYCNACTALPVPEQADHCRLSIKTKGITQGVIKEVLFGPKILGSLVV